MVDRRRLALPLSAALVCACATGPSPIAEPGDGGHSLVEYIPVKRLAPTPSRPPAPAAMYVRADDDGDAVQAFPSSVRYEPIALDAPRPDAPRVVPAIEDDGVVHGVVDDDGHAHDGDDADLPEEDRPSARPATRVRANTPVDASYYRPRVLPSGIVVPYPLDHVFRGFGPCIGKRHHHEAIDIGGVGPDWGVGTPIHAMAKAEVVFIGTGATNPDDFGLPDRRAGESQRGARLLPRSARIEPYGDVYFFTRKKGRWRSGSILVTRALEGPLAGHTIRYLHVAAIHPDLRVGSIVAAGQEVALMGGTGVQESAPHLHLDVEAPDGRRLDAAALLGLPATATCKARTSEAEDKITRARASSLPVLPPPSDTKKVASVASKTTAATPEADEAPSGVLARDAAVPTCGTFSQKEDFSSGRYRAHSVTLDAKKGDRFAVELQRQAGAWKPKLVVNAKSKAVKVQWLGTGQGGKRAYAVVEVKKSGPIELEVSAWDKPQPPLSARYQLEVSERCKKPGRR